MIAEEQDPPADDQAEEFTAGLEPAEDTDTGQEDAVEEATETADPETSAEETSEADSSKADDAEESQSSEAASGDNESEEKKSSEEAAVKKKSPKEESEEGEPADDHPDAIAALKDLGARLDLNKHERVWRVFFYENHDDEMLDHIRGLPSLKELWLVHTGVTSEGAEKTRERLEGVTIYHC